jgi:hypothetical protein
VHDGEAIATWLLEEVVPQEQRPESLKAQLHARCQTIAIEPPSDRRIPRFIDSVRKQYAVALYARTSRRLSLETRAALEALLAESDNEESAPPDPMAPDWTSRSFHDLQTDPGCSELKTLQREVAQPRVPPRLRSPSHHPRALPQRPRPLPHLVLPSQRR